MDGRVAGIAVHHDRIGEIAGAHTAKLAFHPQYTGVVSGGVLHDLNRMKAGFFMQFHLADQPS
jgi:predicted methyltransferase MtxX (methanogen marker protein 4)